jgi:hypothetical protein
MTIVDNRITLKMAIEIFSEDAFKATHLTMQKLILADIVPCIYSFP